jgi:integrase
MMKNGNGSELPKSFRRLVSEKSNKVTFEVMAGVVGGVKVRKNFGEYTYGSEAAALAAARHWYADKRAEIRRDGSAVLAVSDHNRLAYAEAIERLKPYGKTILQAVNTAIEIYKGDSIRSVSFQEASRAFLKHKHLENCRPSYLSDIKARFSAMGKTFNDRKLSQITTAELQDYLLKRQIGPVSWNNWRRNLRIFYNFCAKEPNRWVKFNPADAIALKKINEEEVTILAVDQARKVLRAAVQSCARQLPWLALGLFAGLRREEADKAQWEDINWEMKVIRVRSSKVRSASSRYVQLAEAAIEFLSLFKSESGPIGTNKYARRFDLRNLSLSTGLDCVSNVYRHSFGSYHLAMNQDQAATMFQMGHQNAKTFVDWYRRPIPGIVAHAYWAIRPETLG